MTSRQHVIKARGLLEKLREILEGEGETNCVRGVIAALKSLDDPDIERGYLEARSIYKTVAQGNAPLSEYYINRANFDEQFDANRRFDALRDELWKLFDVIN